MYETKNVNNTYSHWNKYKNDIQLVNNAIMNLTNVYGKVSIGIDI